MSLKELAPGLARVGVLKNPTDPGHPTLWKENDGWHTLPLDGGATIAAAMGG
jgi:hypothetical protein